MDVILCCIIYLKYGSLLIILFEEVLGAAVDSVRSNINFIPDIFMIFLFMCIFLTFLLYFIPGELEETAAELEMCRRKLATLRSQKESAAMAPPTPGATLPGVKIEGGDRGTGGEKTSRESRELEAALEEAKVLELATSYCVVCILIGTKRIVLHMGGTSHLCAFFEGLISTKSILLQGILIFRFCMTLTHVLRGMLNHVNTSPYRVLLQRKCKVYQCAMMPVLKMEGHQKVCEM